MRQIIVGADGRRETIAVAIDPTLIANTGDHSVKALGSRGALALVLDSYSSRPQSMSRCQAGRERYVRLVDLAARCERYIKLVESCLRNVVPGDPVASWSTDPNSFTVNLVSEPSLRVTINQQGHVTVTTGTSR